MSQYIILRSDNGKLNLSRLSKEIKIITSSLQYSGSCMYFPSPKNNDNEFILCVNKMQASDLETEWFLRTLKGHLEAEMIYNGSELFIDSDDNRIDYYESVPSLDEDLSFIRLGFSINSNENNITEKICHFFSKRKYDINIENDGITVFLCSNSYLDIFIDSDKQEINCEIDLTFSGAGVFSDVVELAKDLGDLFLNKPVFICDPQITYIDDLDFEKLRLTYHKLIKQLFLYALQDDREGIQAYLGWGTDSFEPISIPGSIVTPYGRYNIEKIIDEIKKYGFSYVCDNYFLARNTRCPDPRDLNREVMNYLWSTTVGSKDRSFLDEEKDTLETICNYLENLLSLNEFAPFPDEIYDIACVNLGRKFHKHPNTQAFNFHYKPGYLRNDVFYGFGHYLRKFRLPGSLSRFESSHGYDAWFSDNKHGGFRLEVSISYKYNLDGSESPFGKNFVLCEASEFQIIDIGGSSYVRFITSKNKNGKYIAEAEAYILDEVIRFAAMSNNYDDILMFETSLRESVSVEDWYDELIREDPLSPHAPGATCCKYLGYCCDEIEPLPFDTPFPISPEFVTEILNELNIDLINKDTDLSGNTIAELTLKMNNISKIVDNNANTDTKNETNKE